MCQIKWDTCPSNVPSIRLKTKESVPKQVGHSRRALSVAQTILSVLLRPQSCHQRPHPRVESVLLAFSFYSTMNPNRNRYISMKAKGGCAFYSTIIGRGRRARQALGQRQVGLGVQRRIGAFAGCESGVACGGDHGGVVCRKRSAGEVDVHSALRSFGFER